MPIRNVPIGPGSKIPNVTDEQARALESGRSTWWQTLEDARSAAQRAASDTAGEIADPGRLDQATERLGPVGDRVADQLEELLTASRRAASRRDSPHGGEVTHAPDVGRPIGGERQRPRPLLFAVMIAGLLLLVGLFHANKPMPRGTSIASEPAPGHAEMLIDLTYDRDGARIHEQQIFDRIFDLIRNARGFLLVDMFLFNDFAGEADGALRPLSAELTAALLALRGEQPDMPIILVTDPINTIYGGHPAPHLDRLESAGIAVVYTKLEELRDSNPLYSTLWRLLFSWLGNDVDGNSLTNPFQEGDQVSMRSYLHLLNFKANHRKVVATLGLSGQPVAIVSSANPHDASAAHSNIAFVVGGDTAAALVESELQVAAFSGLRSENEIRRLLARQRQAGATPSAEGDLASSQLLTEGQIGRAIVADLESLQEGDAVLGALFYLSWRPVVEGLVAAAQRGVDVRLILDANRDAFGREKGGVPNRPVAHELRVRTDDAIRVRWYETRGEQFHTKALFLRRGDTMLIHGGSANLTRRNVADLNMEANVRLEVPRTARIAVSAVDYFERLWTNRGGTFTADYETYSDSQLGSYWRYRLGEATGMSTF